MVPVRSDEPWRSAAVVCFDVSETLVAWEAAYEAALREAMREWVARLSEGGETLTDAAMREYRKQRKLGRSKADSVRRAVVVLQGVPDDRTARALRSAAKRQQPRRAAFVPGAEETLRALSSRKRLAIVTNLEPAIAKELWVRLRLHRFVQEKDVFASAFGLRKPEPRLFRGVAARLGVPCGRCVMVGDSYRRDIAGAARAGWSAVWIGRNARRAASPRSALGRRMRLVPSISELPKLFRHP